MTVARYAARAAAAVRGGRTGGSKGAAADAAHTRETAAIGARCTGCALRRAPARAVEALVVTAVHVRLARLVGGLAAERGAVAHLLAARPAAAVRCRPAVA
jgi:hypothetical protein